MKTIKNFDEWENFIDEIKPFCNSIFINNKKIDKRKNINDDMEDIFDNNVIVSYYIENKNVYIKI